MSVILRQIDFDFNGIIVHSPILEVDLKFEPPGKKLVSFSLLIGLYVIRRQSPDSHILNI
jgi:hypothetical protein